MRDGGEAILKTMKGTTENGGKEYWEREERRGQKGQGRGEREREREGRGERAGETARVR